MLDRIAELRSVAAEFQPVRDLLCAGMLVQWYDFENDQPVLRSRITGLNNYGFYVDMYPNEVPIMTIPYSTVVMTYYGPRIVMNNPALRVCVNRFRTRRNSIPKAQLKAIKK